jgi:histone acetyltransferase 1
MVSTFLSDPYCHEITVEDPNEAFDDLRDYCDYARLMADGSLDKIAINTNVDPKATLNRRGARVPTSKLIKDKAALQAIRWKHKLAPRQFDRLVELHTLSLIPAHSRQGGLARLTRRANSADEGDRALYYWRLLAKQRVWKKNKDVLKQLDGTERIEKLEETVSSMAEDYERLLRAIVARAEGAEYTSERPDRGKRKIVEDDSDEEMGAEGGSQPEKKRLRGSQEGDAGPALALRASETS